MAAVATDLRDVLIGRILTMIAAVLLLSANRACTCVVPALVIIRHKSSSPLSVLNFAVVR